MKALTICQPYAELIVSGAKRVENRTWPTKHRGLLYVHAGKSRVWLTEHNYGIPPNRMEFGAVVGIVDLVDCLPAAEILAGKWDEKHPGLSSHEHVNGPWCWVLAHPIPIGPWPWKGQLGLFDIDDGALDRVANQILGIAEPSALPELHTQRTDNAQTNT